MSELEKEVGFSLESKMEDHNFMIMDWKWVVRCNDFDFYNKIAEKLGGKIAENKYEKKSFSYNIPNRGQYNFWFNI